MFRPLSLALVITAAVVRPAHADDQAQAAEHVSLAQQAEQRKDWRAAIRAYEAAYAASPQPAVLYEIARNYEQVDAAREAAEHYRRYLEQAEAPPNRDEVEQRIATLRSRPSQVDVTAQPAGAVVFLDGAELGPAPLTVEVDAGEHRAYAAHRGRASEARQFRAEFGETVALHFDLTVANGLLIVRSNVDGATVRVDGERAGRTPFSGPVRAGKRQIAVAREGYRAAQRSVTIAPGGSHQLRADLERIAGAMPPDDEPKGALRWLFGLSYGYDAGFEASRFGLNLGLRLPSERAEVSFLFAAVGNGRTGLGAEGRWYFHLEGVRPYLRAGALILGDGQASTSDRLLGIEASAGVLLATASPRYRAEYYLEIGAHAVVAGLDSAPEGDGPPRFGVPVIVGLQWSVGRP